MVLSAEPRYANTADHKFWDDLTVGDRLRGPGVTITDSHLVTWAGLTGDLVSLHLDEEYARATQFGQRIAHGPLIMSLMLGLITQTGYMTNVVAWLGVDQVRAMSPTFIGDTVHPEAEVVVSRPTSKPGRGLWTLEYSAINQHRTTVMTFTGSFIIATRDH